MKNKFITLLLFLFFINSIHAQHFEAGLLCGLSTSQVDGDTQKDFKKLGFYGGVFVTRAIGEISAFRIELYYIGKGAKKNIGGIDEFETQLNYIELPIMYTVEPIKDIELSLGLASSYLISSKLYSFGELFPSSTYDIHSFDFSGIITGSYYFLNNVAFNFRYSYSIIPFKNYPNWYNSNLSFGIIYEFNHP